MSLKKKILDIILLIIPVLLMVILIPIILNDYSLAGIYLLIIGMFFILGYKKKDWQFFLFGLIAMTISESFFISTGVESFARNSLLVLYLFGCLYFGHLPL